MPTDRPARRVVVSSAARLRTDDPATLRMHLATKDDWQERAWDFYDLVGEVKDAANFVADAMARIRFYPAIRPDSEDKTADPSDDEFARVQFARLGNVQELARKAGKHLFVAGETYLVGLLARPADGERPARPERFFMASKDEINARSGGETTVECDGEKVELGPKDFLARIWREHPRRAVEADSSVRGVLSACETLVATDQTVRAIIRQRAASGSIIAVPDDVTVGALDPTDNSGEVVEGEDPVIDTIVRAFVTPTTQPGTAADVSPIVLVFPRGAAGEKSGIEVHRVDRPFDDMFDKITDRSLHRLAQGMAVNVERVFGLGTATHWGGGQIQESDYRDYIQPFAEIFAVGLTEVFLRPGLADPGDQVVGYDPSALVVRSDLQSAVDFGVEHDLASGDDWRRIKGIAGDGPSEDEIRRKLLREQARKGLVSAEAAATGTSEVPVHITERPAGEPQESPPSPQLSGDPTAPPARVAAAPRASLGRRLAAIDRDLRLRVREAAEAALLRAEERAAGRITSRVRSDQTLRQLIRDVPDRALFSIVGEDTLARFNLPIHDLTDEFAALHNRVYHLAIGAWETTRRTLNVVNDRLPAARDDWAIHAADALVARLRDLMAARLRNPNHGVSADGEHDVSTAVPALYAREFVALAGGQHHALTAGLLGRIGDWVTRGVGTGDETMKIAADEYNVVQVGWMWDYGSAARATFEPHLELDGTEFQDFSELENAASFPDSDYFFPGDHDGCGCDAVPVVQEVLFTPEAAGEEDQAVAAAALTAG